MPFGGAVREEIENPGSQQWEPGLFCVFSCRDMDIGWLTSFPGR